MHWGEFDIMNAEVRILSLKKIMFRKCSSYSNVQKKLFRAALKDPLNEMFFVLSESCIPLHPLSMMRSAVLRAGNKSFVNACHQDHHFAKTVQYNEKLGKVGVSINNFKKSEQWVGLTRRHAQLIANESRIAEMFHALKIKFSDEHYIPTVLSFYRQGPHTSCGAGLTFTNWHWWHKPSHPKVPRLHSHTYSHYKFFLRCN